MKDSVFDLLSAEDLKKSNNDITITFLKDILKEDKFNNFIKCVGRANKQEYIDSVKKFNNFERELSIYIIEGSNDVSDKLFSYLNDEENYNNLFKLCFMYKQYRKEQIVKLREIKYKQFLLLNDGVVPKHTLKKELGEVLNDVRALLYSDRYDPDELIKEKLIKIESSVNNALTVFDKI